MFGIICTDILLCLFPKGIPDLGKYGDVYELTYGSGRGHSPTSVALRKEVQRQILYQLSPKEVPLVI